MTQFTREYKSSKEAQAAMAAMHQLGFDVVSVSGLDQRVGLGRIAFLGIFAFAFKPKAHVIVVYRGDAEPPTAAQLTRAARAAKHEQARASIADARASLAHTNATVARLARKLGIVK